MHPSRRALLNPSLRNIASPHAIDDPDLTCQPDYDDDDPEPDYDDQDDEDFISRAINPLPPVYDQVRAYPRHPPEAFNEMMPWDPSKMDDGDSLGPDDTDTFRNDPRLILSVGQFVGNEEHELPDPARVSHRAGPHPYKNQERQRNSPPLDRRHPQPARNYPQEPSNSTQHPEWSPKPEVYDMTPRRRSSGFANNLYDPIRQRHSSGREPSNRRHSVDRNDVNFDDLNDRRKESLQALGYEDPSRRKPNLVPPHRDSVYSVGSETERIGMDPEEDQNYRHEFVPLRNRFDSDQTNHYTMRDAVRMAHELHLMDEANQGQPLVPAQEIPQENDVQSPDGFENVAKRQCWTRYCQSHDYHAHVMRRIGGVTTEVDSRERLRSHYGSHVTSKASWHMNQTKTWIRFKERIAEIVSNFAVWHHSLKQIEGHFGTSIASYFIFIRWLLLLNVVIFVIMFSFVVIPYILKDRIHYVNKYIYGEGDCAFDYYKPSGQNITIKADEAITQFLQGTGWMEKTSMFMGMYETVSFDVNSVKYSLPLAYLLAGLAVMLFSLIIMLRTTSKGFKESVITSEGHLYNYCNTVFGGWDFCINRPEAAALKHEMLTTELISCLGDEKRKQALKNRTRKEQIVIYAIRCFVWLIIMAMLTGSGYGIYMGSNFTLNETRATRDCGSNATTSTKTEEDTKTIVWALFVEYLPTLIITALNVSLPLFFYGLVEFEKYSPAYVVVVNLSRTLLLRLASIGVLLYSFLTQIKSNNDLEENNLGKNCTSGKFACGIIECWETYIGQQLYKLVLLDFVVIILLTFGVGFLRMILTTKVEFQFFKWIGQEQFDIPKHVLDLVYSQTLCWLGTFFSPLLPAACVVKCLLMFYIKKFHLFVNCVPSRQPYRASKSNAVFIMVLLISFGVFALVPFVYSIAELTPSKSCGPFRTKHFMWQVVEEIEWPDGFHHVITVIGSSLFAVPVIILLLLVIYYYYTVSASYKNMSIVLKDHLMMEGQDKQFLLERLNDVTIRMLSQGKSGPNTAKALRQAPGHGQANQYSQGDNSEIQTAYF